MTIETVEASANEGSTETQENAEDNLADTQTNMVQESDQAKSKTTGDKDGENDEWVTFFDDLEAQADQAHNEDSEKTRKQKQDSGKTRKIAKSKEGRETREESKKKEKVKPKLKEYVEAKLKAADEKSKKSKGDTQGDPNRRAKLKKTLDEINKIVATIKAVKGVLETMGTEKQATIEPEKAVEKPRGKKGESGGRPQEKAAIQQHVNTFSCLAGAQVGAGRKGSLGSCNVQLLRSCSGLVLSFC